MVKHDIKTWGMSIDDYELGKWGTAIGSFKVPPTIYKRFSAKYPDKANASGVLVPVWKEPAFEEIAIIFINAIVARYEILRLTDFNYLDEDTRINLKKAVYNAIEYSCLNRQLWEVVNDVTMQGPSMSLSADKTNWLLTNTMIGQKAVDYITISEIEEYRWVDENTLYIEENSGNIKVIGKVDIEQVPDLAQFVY